MVLDIITHLLYLKYLETAVVYDLRDLRDLRVLTYIIVLNARKYSGKYFSLIKCPLARIDLSHYSKNAQIKRSIDKVGMKSGAIRRASKTDIARIKSIYTP